MSPRKNLDLAAVICASPVERAEGGGSQVGILQRGGGFLLKKIMP